MYTEGSQSYLTVAAATGGRDTVEYVVMNPEHPVYSKPLAPGRYTITSWQRPCDGNCSNLDPATDRCHSTISMPSNAADVSEHRAHAWAWMPHRPARTRIAASGRCKAGVGYSGDATAARWLCDER